VQPNDHVNMAQYTKGRDPHRHRLAGPVGAASATRGQLGRLARAFLTKGRALDQILKSGRTQLQDAKLDSDRQEFAAYRHTIELSDDRVPRKQLR